MLEFYRMLEKLESGRGNIVMTVLNGTAAGEKAMASNGELLWESQTDGFFSKRTSIVKQIRETGTVDLAGTKVFCEYICQEQKIVICGGGHVSIPLIQIGLMLGFSVIVLEDRPKFADDARRAGAGDVICDDFQSGLKRIEGDQNTFFVIVTRGHRYDKLCLKSILEKPHAYIGMIGSKKRVGTVKEGLLENGADEDALAHVYTPIGLNIGAETPEEIAVAILAEIIKVKNEKKSGSGYPKEIIQGILGSNTGTSRKVLATIAARKGSAPREVGTKMLVLEDGRCIGTIGGGCVESDIFQTALLMIRSEETKSRLYHVDMTGRDAEDEGMVCGGTIDVLLEVV